MSQSNQETLTYLRKATHSKDNADGLLYLHKWATGYQELIFPDEVAAQRWFDTQNNRDGMD